MAMAPPYGRDPFTQLNRLLDVQHTKPGHIREVCIAVEQCLESNRDNLRGFFDKPFANLLKRVFGYGDFEASWLNIITKGRERESDARALVDLLAPDGKLFSAMAQADNDRLVQYIFPTERLPAHTQELLKEPQGLGRRVLDTWPQYRRRIRQDMAGRPQVYLNLFEYFMFWTAFYMLRGSASDGSRSEPRVSPGPSSSSMMYGMSGIRSVGTAIVGSLMSGRPAGPLQDHPYYRLLKTYLEFFLPRSVGPNGGTGAATTAGAGGADNAAAAAASQSRCDILSSSTMMTGRAAAGGAMPYSGLTASGVGTGGGGGAGAAAAAAANACGWASYKPTLTAAAAGPDSRGSVLLSVLVEFWLTDHTEPLPALVFDRMNGPAMHPGDPGVTLGGAAAAAAAAAAVGGGGGGGMFGVPGMAGGSPGGLPPGAGGGATSLNPAAAISSMPPTVRILTYQPPSPELVEALVALVRYVYVVERGSPSGGGGAAAAAAAAGGAAQQRQQLQLQQAGGAAAVAAARGLRTPVPSDGGGRVSFLGSAGRGGNSAGRGYPTSYGEGTPGGLGAAPAPPVLTPAQGPGCAPWLPETPVKTPPPPPPRLAVPPTPLMLLGHSASPAVQAVARKVYRQLRRAFTQWPAGSPASLTPLITLWLSVLAPWCPPYAHTRKSSLGSSSTLDAGAGGGGDAAYGGGGLNGGGVPAAAGGGAAGLSHQHHQYHQQHHAGLEGLGSAAAGVVEATAARLHLGGGLGRGGDRERERDRDLAGVASRELLCQFKYTPAWRGHVLAHLPFYLILLPQFASLSLSRLKYRPDAALRDLDRVLAVLAASGGPELLRELREAEAAYNSFARPVAAAAGAGAGRRMRGSEGAYSGVLAWWLEQAQDFEVAAAGGSLSLAGGGLPLAGGRPDIPGGHLFTAEVGGDEAGAGAAYTTCILLRNAETLGRPELVAALRQSAAAVLPLEAILPAAVAESPVQLGPPAAGGRAYPRAGRWSALIQSNPRFSHNPAALWEHLYRGPDNRHDPLLRPIASNEVACLVRPLVRASVRVNAALGLDVPYRPCEEVDDPPEHLGKSALLWARKRGYRLNLRVFAEVQTLLWLLGVLLLMYAIVRACSGPGGGGGATTGGFQAPTAAGGPNAVFSGGGGGSRAGGGGYYPYGHQPYSNNYHLYDNGQRTFGSSDEIAGGGAGYQHLYDDEMSGVWQDVADNMQHGGDGAASAVSYEQQLRHDAVQEGGMADASDTAGALQEEDVGAYQFGRR